MAEDLTVHWACFTDNRVFVSPCRHRISRRKGEWDIRYSISGAFSIRCRLALCEPRLLFWCSASYLNQLVRSRQHIRWNRETDLLRGLQIDQQLELRRLLYRQVCGLSTFEDLVNICGGATR